MDLEDMSRVLTKPLRPLWYTPSSALFIDDVPDFSGRGEPPGYRSLRVACTLSPQDLKSRLIIARCRLALLPSGASERVRYVRGRRYVRMADLLSVSVHHVLQVLIDLGIRLQAQNRGQATSTSKGQRMMRSRGRRCVHCHPKVVGVLF